MTMLMTEIQAADSFVVVFFFLVQNVVVAVFVDTF